MDARTHERVSALFLELRGLEVEERLARLAVAAGGDERLRAEVLSLLVHDLEPAAGGTGEAGAESHLPSTIGPYTILRRVGHGGSGFVLLAEQHSPVRRRVAIKVVPYAAINPEFAARFEFERRALERTDHPNIARILDAGRTGDGLPYLVMDYVEGVTITAYAVAHRLGIRERVELMLDVADAVQHAHQRGVIHRDLKPGNILVSEVNGRATPRVLDFGIAKPTAEAVVTEAPATSGLALGTPAYMAPEQTGGRVVDTRADVYALGAVLYELVSGRPPIDTSGDPLEAMRRVRDQTPQPASRIKGTAGAADGAGVTRALLGDLDCVLAKALEKEPARRYATVAGFSEDLVHVLKGEVITARPATPGYRFRRFARRNRGLVVGSGAVAAALLLGIGGLMAGLVEARRQKAEAVNQGEAQREINRFLNEDLLASASPEQQGTAVTAIELLNRASKRVDQRFEGRPLIAAAVHHTLGNAYAELGAFEDAERHLTRALELRRAGAGPDAPDTVRSEIAAASLLARRDRLKEAEAALTGVMPRARDVLGKSDSALYAALNDLGTVQTSLDQGPAAVASLTEALEGRRRLLGEADPQVLMSMSNLGQAYERVGDTQGALGMYVEALRVAEGLAEPPVLTLIGLNNNIGATYQDLNQDKEAAPYLRKAAALASNWLGPDSPDTLTLEGNLAGLEVESGNAQAGAELYEKVVAARARLMGIDAPETLTARYGYWNSVWHTKRFDEAAAGFAALLVDITRALGEGHWLAVQTRVSLARAQVDGGHASAALENARRGAAEFLALYGPDHTRTRTAKALVTEIEGKLAGGG